MALSDGISALKEPGLREKGDRIEKSNKTSVSPHSTPTARLSAIGTYCILG